MSREDSSGQVLAPPDALERVRDGVVALDTDFVCTYVNDAAAAFFGRPRADLPGTSVWEVLGDDADLRDRLETASETGRRTVFEHADADGERWLEGRVYPEADGVTVYLTETTARTETDSARHRRNCQLTTLVENLTEAVYAKDADGYYEFANEPAAALFGVDAADLVGARDEDLFDDETAAAVRSVDERVTARDAADSREVVREVDGETRVFCAHTYPVHDEEGTVVGVVGRSRDVTGHAARERERERQQYLFDSVQDVADIGVWEYELATGTLTWSDGTRAIHGVDASYEPTVTDALAFYHPDDREQVEAAVDRAREHGDRYDLDLRLVRADGDVRDVRTYGEVVVDDERDGPVLRGVIQDITEHRARERELEQYRAFVENSADTISIVDGDGVIQFISSATQRAAGVPPERFVGTDAFAFVHPDDRATAEARFERARSEPGESYRYQYRGREADGSWVWLESVCVNRLDDDDIEGFVVVTRDITERKRHEQERTALAEEYEAVFENADDGIFLIDVDSDGDDADPVFRYSRLNPSHETQMGLTTTEITGRTPREVLGDDRGAAAERYYRRCVETRAAVTYDEAFTVPDSETVWQTKLAPVVVDDTVTRIVGIARDVTDRVEYERELQRKNERLDEFASVISHDIRNPLSVALGRVQLLEEESASEHLPPTVRSLMRIEAIVDDTLTLARHGETVAETAPISFASLVGQCWGTVDVAEATLDIEDEFTLHGDRDRLRHVFENLFSNSVEHGGPTVTVRVGRLGDDGIYVADDGPGIPTAERATVFEPGHKSSAGGTGFGLTIVRRIVEAHGWTVTAAESDTGGARFEFTGVDVHS